MTTETTTPKLCQSASRKLPAVIGPHLHWNGEYYQTCSLAAACPGPSCHPAAEQDALSRAREWREMQTEQTYTPEELEAEGQTFGHYTGGTWDEARGVWVGGYWAPPPAATLAQRLGWLASALHGEMGEHHVPDEMVPALIDHARNWLDQREHQSPACQRAAAADLAEGIAR
jgi:hypothetical protein